MSSSNFYVDTSYSALELSRNDFYENIFAFDDTLTNDIGKILADIVEDFDPGESLVPTNPDLEYRYDETPDPIVPQFNTYLDHVSLNLSTNLKDSGELNAGLDPLASFDMESFEGIEDLFNLDIKEVLDSYFEDVFLTGLNLKDAISDSISVGPLLNLAEGQKIDPSVIFGNLVEILFSTGNSVGDYVEALSTASSGIYAGEMFEAAKENAKHEQKKKKEPNANGSFSEDNSVPSPMMYSTPFAASLFAYTKEFKETSKTFVNETIPKLLGEDFDKAKYESIKTQFVRLAGNLETIANLMANKFDNQVEYTKNNTLSSFYEDLEFQRNKLIFFSASQLLDKDKQANVSPPLSAAQKSSLSNWLNSSWNYIKKDETVHSLMQSNLNLNDVLYRNNLGASWEDVLTINENVLMDLDKDYDLDEADLQEFLYRSIDSTAPTREEVLTRLNQRVDNIRDQVLDPYEDAFHQAFTTGDQTEIDNAFSDLLENSSSPSEIVALLDSIDGTIDDSLDFSSVDFEDLNDTASQDLIYALDFDRDGEITSQDIQDMLGTEEASFSLDLENLGEDDTKALEKIFFNYLDAKPSLDSEELALAEQRRDFYQNYGDANPATSYAASWDFLKAQTSIHSEIQSQIDSLPAYNAVELDLDGDGSADIDLDRNADGSLSLDELLDFDLDYDGDIDSDDHKALFYRAMGASTINPNSLLVDLNTAYSNLNTEAKSAASTLLNEATNSTNGFLFDKSASDFDSNGVNDLLDLDKIHLERKNAREVSNNELSDFESSKIAKQYLEIKKMLVLMMFLADMERSAWDEQVAQANTAAYEVY
jgi:hypothetical protein